jgi:uncharacterized damage-inducible protein DinB
MDKINRKLRPTLIHQTDPRTGTKSMKEALTHILSGQCYHMETVIQGFQEEGSHWRLALEDQASVL